LNISFPDRTWERLSEAQPPVPREDLFLGKLIARRQRDPQKRSHQEKITSTTQRKRRIHITFGSSSDIPDPERLTKNLSQLANQLNLPVTEIRKAIHKLKRDGLPRSGSRRNPDVMVDSETGEVDPEIEGGGVGDSIGNIFDYLL